MKVKILQFGFGSLGKQICKEILQNNRFKVIQIIDKNPALKGLDPGKFFKTETRLRIQEVKKSAKPDVIFHSTVSNISDAYEQFKALATYNVPILSTCEELVYPTGKNKKIARKINRLAMKNHIPILGIGVNPGYLMDSLVLTLSNLLMRVNLIKVSRTVNLTNRRKALQEKMLVGQKITQFQKIRKGQGHIGLEESATMICDHFKIKPHFKKTVTPILAKKKTRTKFFIVEKGEIIGIKEKLVVKNRKKPFLKMHLEMYLGAHDIDKISLRGNQSVNFETSGVNGDRSTVALLLNYIPKILNKPSGLFMVSSQDMVKFKP